MTEHDLQNAIRLELSKHGYVERANVGKVKMEDGRYFDTGLPKGRSDLLFVKDGLACFIEVKAGKNKPTPEQLNFIAQMKNRYGARAGVAYSVKDALEICGGGDLNGFSDKFKELYGDVYIFHKNHYNAETDVGYEDLIKDMDNLQSKYKDSIFVSNLLVAIVDEIERGMNTRIVNRSPETTPWHHS